MASFILNDIYATIRNVPKLRIRVVLINWVTSVRTYHRPVRDLTNRSHGYLVPIAEVRQTPTGCSEREGRVNRSVRPIERAAFLSRSHSAPRMAATREPRRTVVRRIARRPHADWPVDDATPLDERSSLDGLESDIRTVSQPRFGTTATSRSRNSSTRSRWRTSHSTRATGT